MNRNDALFLVIGLLVGFIGGYLMQDVMLDRQPARLVHGEGGVAASGGSVPTGAPSGSSGQEKLQEMQRLEAYVQANPQDAGAILRLANLSFDVESWARCAEMYERYIKLEPATPDLLSDMGVCYRGIGQLDRAIELFDQAHEMNPSHWPSLFNKAVVLGIDRRDFDAAAQVLAELRTLQPNNPQVERLAEELERLRGDAA